MDIPSEESVGSLSDLLEFMENLVAGLRDGRFQTVNNDTISYLDAASGWLGGIEGYYLRQEGRVPENPDWRLVAAIFAAALVYE